MEQMNVTNTYCAFAQAAMIAALYIVLTFIANLLGIASGAVQIRFSEALTILPYFYCFHGAWLTVGCLLANILTGCALPDIILSEHWPLCLGLFLQGFFASINGSLPCLRSLPMP